MASAIDNLTQKVQESLGRIALEVDGVIQQSANSQENTRSAILALSSATITLQSKQIEGGFDRQSELQKRDEWLGYYIQWAISFIDDRHKGIIAESASRSHTSVEQGLRLGSLIELAVATINCQRLVLENLSN